MIVEAVLEEMHEALLARAAVAAGQAFGQSCAVETRAFVLAADPVPAPWPPYVPPFGPVDGGARRRPPARGRIRLYPTAA